MKKKIISSILSLAMLLSLLPVAAFAAETTSPPSLKLGFEATAEGANTALGIDSNADPSAKCDPKTMYVLINDAQKDDKYTVKVTKGNAEVWTQDEFTTQAVNGISKVYFAFDYTGADIANHSVAKIALTAGDYLFTVTRNRAGEVSTRTATLTLAESSGNFTASPQSEIKEIAFTDTGFAADAARANTALEVTDAAASAQCDPNTMWAKFTLDGVENNNYTMKVTAADKDVYTEETLKGTFTKAYFTVDEDLVASQPSDHSVAKIAAAEGVYTFTLMAKGTTTVLAKATLDLGKLTVKNSTNDATPTEVFFNTAAKETVGVLISDIADPTTPPTEGKVFTGWKTGSDNPITTEMLKKTALTRSVEYVAQWGDASTPVEKPLSVQSAGFAWGYADGNRESGKTDCLDQTMWLNVTGGDASTEYFFDVVKGTDVFYSESFMGYGADVSGTPRWSYVHSGQNPGDKILTPGTYTINVYDNSGKAGTPIAATTVTVPAFPTEDYAMTVVANNNVTDGEGVITATMPTALKGRYYVELSKKDDTSKEFVAVAGKSFGTEADPTDTANKGGLFGTNVYQPIKFEGLSLTANGEYRVAIYQRSSKDTAENPSKAAGSVYLVSGTVTVGNTVVAPATVPPVMGDKIPSDQTEAVKAAAENISTNDVAMAAAVAKTDVTEPTTAEINNAAAELKVEASALKTVVQHYTQVTATEYKKDGSGNAESITFDIKPMYRVVVTSEANPSNITVDGQTPNAVVVGEGAKELEIKEPVAMTIGLPAGFAASGTKVYVQHKKTNSERTYEYTTTVKEDETTHDLSVEFVNPHGFSTFTVSKNSTAVAEIDGVGYTTLQQAVDAAKNNDIITLKSDLTGDNAKATISGTTNKTINFVLDTNVAGPVNLTINGDTVTVNKADGGNYTYVVPSEEDKPSTGGGGVSSNVIIERPTNGKVTVTPTAPSKGATVTINLTPDTGYQAGTVTVTDKDGNAVELTKVSDTKYTFTMPAGKVTVKATFTKVDTPPATGFTDVAADAYYADAVKWAVEKGITNGLTATTFGPNNSCTRGQMVTFLWRAAGSPAATGTNSFSDVASGEYYYNAVLWAVEKGITNGTSATTFSPNATVNRGQTVTFLYRYAESPAATGDTSFTDVTADAFYADAVKWAVAEEITNGTSNTTFSPASNCTRGQIVTFMYRQMAE